MDSVDGEYDIIVDGIFGYSFTGEIRDPYDKIISQLAKKNSKVCAIGRKELQFYYFLFLFFFLLYSFYLDIPSG